MKEYPKIQSIFKRYEDGEKKGKFIEGRWSLPEFELLKGITWVWTEKVDGTNVRVMWNCEMKSTIGIVTPPIKLDPISATIKFSGKTDDAQVPTFLLSKLQELFTVEKVQEVFPEANVCLYGEGYGARIQKGGGNYIPDGVDFVLFDVLVDGWWLKREDIEDVANKLRVKTVPIVGQGTIQEAINVVRNGLESEWGNFEAEGLVLKPKIELKNRKGERIITKLKHKDFWREK